MQEHSNPHSNNNYNNYANYGNGYPSAAYPPQPAYRQDAYAPYAVQPDYTPYPQYNTAQEHYRSLRNKELLSILGKGFLLGGALISLLVISLIVSLVIGLFIPDETVKNDAVAMYSFNAIASHLTSILIPFAFIAWLMRKKINTPIVPMKKLGALKTSAWVAFGMGICMLANIITAGVIALFKAIGYELTQPDFPEIDSWFAIVVAIISTAVLPAILEEFAMRCSALSILRQHGKAFSVIAVSIVFGLMHGNVIQFVFAFIIGLVLGYITVQTDSVVPAMLIHGLNNGISVTSQSLTYTSGAKMAETVSSDIFIGWIVCSIIALIYLITTRQLTGLKEEQPPELHIPLIIKILCLLPGLAIPFYLLILLTMQSIQPIAS